MTEDARHRPFETTLRISAALFGTLPVVVFASVCLGRFLPFTEATRFALGFALAIPSWIALMCLIFLTRSARFAWCACLGASAVLAAACWMRTS